MVLIAILVIIAFFVAAFALFNRDSVRADMRAFTEPKARDIQDFELEPYNKNIKFYNTVAWVAGFVLVVSIIICATAK
jgi:hypothetical protein